MALYPFKDFVTTMKDGVSKALRISGYDEQEDMLKIKSMQNKWRAGFSGTTLNPEKWDVVQQGAGQVITVAGGQMTITTGITANAETIIRSKEEFTIPARVMAHVMLSQRIANQEFHVELVSSNNDPLEPNSDSRIAWQFDGVTATSAKYNVNGGDQPLLSATATVNSTATTGAVFELEPTADEAWFFSRLHDNTAGRAFSFVRHSQIPNPNLKYKIQIRVKNLAVAPATSTTFTSQFVNCSDYAEITAEITAGRGNAVQGQGIYATVGGTVATSGTVTIAGTVAHDATTVNSPITTGARARITNYTAVADNDVANLISTTVGALVVREHCIPEMSFQYTGTLTTIADGVAKTAGTAGIRNYVNGIQFQNTNATATQIVIKDGSTVIWAGMATASMNLPATVTFDQPLRGTSATALNIACLTTGASVLINVQGYQAP